MSTVFAKTDRAFPRESVQISRLAPAKINLALHVVGKRGDGRHLLETVAVFSGPGDRLTFRFAQADCFKVRGPFADRLGPEADNLVLRVRDRLRAMFPGRACPPVAIHLEKVLPVAAGIGGGSSDAAAALHALSRLWRLPMGGSALSDAGLSLGADIPMCLVGRPLLASGIGERIATLAPFPELPMLLVNPGSSVATGEVFAGLGNTCNRGLPTLPASRSLPALLAWLGGLRNDLEDSAKRIAPEIEDVLAMLSRSGAAVARMSGSGATCYGLFESVRARDRAAERIARDRHRWFVMPATSPAFAESGPEAPQ